MSNDDGSRRVSPADDPSNGEIYRLLMTVNSRLDKMVTGDMFTAEQKRVTDAQAAEQRRVDGRFRDLADDITAVNNGIRAEAAERKQAIQVEVSDRKESDVALGRRIDGIGTMARWAIATALVALSVLLGMAGLLLNRGVA